MKFNVKLPGLEGIQVEGDLSEFGLYVSVIETKNARHVLDPRVLWIARSQLSETRTEKDYGEELYHAEFHKGGIDVAYARYKNVATVSVREAARGYERTLYAQNFWDEKADLAIKAVERVMRDGLDPDDLILELKENE